MPDDAASSEQVLPMLPGTGRSLVLVTSRRHLTALDDATTISLDILPPDEAAGLPVRRCGRSSGCGVPAAGDRDADAPADHHPAWSVAGRAAELAVQDRLELMATDDLSVAVAFNLSYRPCTTSTCSPSRARAVPDVRDDPRAHARALADRLDSDTDRDQVTARLLGLLPGRRPPCPPAPPRNGWSAFGGADSTSAGTIAGTADAVDRAPLELLEVAVPQGGAGTLGHVALSPCSG